MILKLIKYLHDKIAAANVLFTAFAMVVLGLVCFEGLVWYNHTSDFCINCHVNRGPYRNIDLDSTAHLPYKNGEKGCLDCHTDKDLHVFAKELVKAGVSGFTRLTTAASYDEFTVRNIPDSDCLACHNKILDVNSADILEISPNLAKIGLKFDHQRHFDFKELRVDQLETFEKLRNTGVDNLDDRQKDEFVLLEKIQLAQCAQCHERNQLEDISKGARKMDREIHFYATNPMRCSGCHVDAVTGEHPGPPLTPPMGLPSEETCSRCHNGLMHGRLAVFPVKCESTEKPYTDYCIKCHPGWKIDNPGQDELVEPFTEVNK